MINPDEADEAKREGEVDRSVEDDQLLVESQEYLQHTLPII